MEINPNYSNLRINKQLINTVVLTSINNKPGASNIQSNAQLMKQNIHMSFFHRLNPNTANSQSSALVHISE